MLKNLHVQNLALIEDADIEFSDGLNILTGETGAGKSLLMGSVMMAMGSKFDTSMIRKGKEQALVELVFDSVPEKALQVLGELDIFPEDDGSVIIKRTCSASKSSCRINGSTVAVREMKKLSQAFIDIHGQRDYETLLKKSELLSILDLYCGGDMPHILGDVSEKYRIYTDLKVKLEEETSDTSSSAKEASLAEFEAAEIDDACLKEGEDEELEDSFRRMSNFRKIAESIGKAHAMIGGEDGENACSLASMALRELSSVSEYDTGIKELEEELASAESILSDLNMELGSYMSSMEFDEEEFARIGDRLDLINRLKSKYGRTIGDILEYSESRKKILEKYADYDAYLAKLREDTEKACADYDKACRKASSLRKKNIPLLEKELTDKLKDLNFLTVDFEIRMEDSKPGPLGKDAVDFYISFNPGEDRKPLAESSSGGELSRMMLAVKTVMAGKEDTGTLIFDEIDAGISGITAWKVAESLSGVAGHHQVICITHLPQIAAMADHHYVIVKHSDNNSTTTDVEAADLETSISEIARLLGSDSVSDSSLENARDLKAKAGKVKTKNR